ncbi:MAG: T9SS type A sorting domain-containing protein [Saprospiraceae bacterium]|nr:T9SS type A sorting domain-containing protein [Saprospiraceae bacterium]
MVFLILVLLLFFGNSLYSQDSILKIYATDAIGNTDTLIFGLRDNTQIGVDPSLGEINLFGTDLNVLDLRIRQRDQANFSCSQIESLDQPVYWPENLDLKKDFRPYAGIEGHQNNTFEVFIYAENYPVTVSVDNSEIGFLADHVLLTGKTAECDEFVVFGTIGPEVYGWTAIDIEESEPILFFSFESFNVDYYLVNAQEETKVKQAGLFIAPNPASTELVVESVGAGQLTVYNAVGQPLGKTQNIDRKTTLQIAHLPSGGYYLLFLDKESGASSIKKFIKD